MLLREQKLVCVANTGPLISAFQCRRIDLLEFYFSLIHVPSSCWAEYEKHGIAGGMQQLIEEGLVVVHILTKAEFERARRIADAIASSPMSRDASPQGHIPDAEAIVLMEREELEASVLLVDELAAREVASRRNHLVTGFPGIVYFAVKYNRITPEAARELLYTCQRAGTYYATRFIESLYLEMKGMVS